MKHGDLIKRKILDTGLKLWRKNPNSVSARGIGAIIGMTHSAVLYHFKNAEGMRNAIANHAVALNDSKIIMHLIAEGHPSVAHMSSRESAKHMRNMNN